MTDALEKMPTLKWAVAHSAFLTLFKATTGFASSSVSLLASALDSLADSGISMVNFLGLRRSAQPPDENHAYGHEKIEGLASYTQGVVIVILALFMIGDSIRRMASDSVLLHSGLVLAAIIVSGMVTLGLTAMLYRAERRTGSLILRAERVHYSTDILSLAVIFLAVGLTRWTGWSGWDLAGGILVAGYLVFLAARLLLSAANELVDHSLPRSSLDRLDALIRHHRGVQDYHELRTCKAGSKSFIDFHLVPKPQQSFVAAHETTESLIEKIRARFAAADITIHEDPEGGR